MQTSKATGNALPLHGLWKRSIGGRSLDYVAVPGSYPPVGECQLDYTFPLHRPLGQGTDRAFLAVEGVLASAEFTLNGQPLGTAGPWVPYRFEIAAGLLQAENTITARVRDIVETFGPTPGRRFDAGIVRDISLLFKPSTFIEAVAFRYTLNEACTSVECEVLVELNGPGSGALTATLAECASGREVATATGAHGDPLRFTVDSPHLWSPEMPHLYTLTVNLTGDSNDTAEEAVGFRRIEVRGQDFYVNNQRLVLKGVCRHEFTSADGYSPPIEEVRRDLALIKHAGFNYIRLVHSPHSACVSRIAAELGLFVTEEPGACFHDLSDPAVAAPALETLRRMVLRDQNCPSIFAWYIYNECHPDVAYAKQAAAVCRGLDPHCLLSFADCTYKREAINEMLVSADLSYYGINQYSTNPEHYTARMEQYADRPLVFTEWGGYQLFGNRRNLKLICDAFVCHVQPDATPRMAGCAFWAWADYEEYSRSDAACVAGWTVEGLLDKYAQPRADLQALSQMCFDMAHQPQVPVPPIEVLARAPQRPGSWRSLDLTAVAGDQRRLEEAVAQMRARFDCAMPIFGRLSVAGIDFACRDADAPAPPLLLGPGREEVIIPVNGVVRAIAVLGHVALRGGYPSSSIFSVHRKNAEAEKTFGQPASRYEFLFDDGTVIQPLQHGKHVLRGNNICRWWKTAPRAPETVPAVQTTLHPTHEVLRFDLWERAFEAPHHLQAIRWVLEDPDSIQALMAVSVLEEEGG